MSVPMTPWGAFALAGLRMGFPEDVSTNGWKVDALFEHILLITGVAFVALEAILIFFVVKYRAKNGATTVEPSLGKAGILWGGFIGAVALTLIVTEGGTWLESSRIQRDKQAGFPDGPDAFRVEVLAEQFMWNFRYPGPDGKFQTDDDVTSVGMLRVPVGRPVVLQMHSKDVLHSFYLPNFREKQDVVPGLTNKLWFKAARPSLTGADGKKVPWEIMCAELCGLGHYTMRAFVVAESEEDLAKYLKDQAEYSNPDDNWGWDWSLGKERR